MDTEGIIKRIDTEIASRSSKNFGVKVGEALFSALVQAGKIQKATFGVMGTSLFECELNAYDGEYAVTLDWDLDDDEFAVGLPK